MSVREQMREIAARPVPDTAHYDPSNVQQLLTPRPTPEPTPGTLVKPRRPRGMSKARRAELDIDRGPEMLGLLLWMVICAAAGCAVGMWIG